MFKTLEDANRMAALARAMAADPAWGSDDARKLIEHASGRIEVTTGEVPSIPLQGVHWPDPALDDISDLVLYLAGDGSRTMTGAQLSIDMGASKV